MCVCVRVYIHSGYCVFHHSIAWSEWGKKDAVRRLKTSLTDMETQRPLCRARANTAYGPISLLPGTPQRFGQNYSQEQKLLLIADRVVPFSFY